MKRWNIIQYLINVNNYKSYLELGTDTGECFEKINIKKKVCVDINNKYKGLNYHMSTDEFFMQNMLGYDIIFIDANHEDEFVWRDIQNSLNYLNWNGAIVCHDCNPKKEEHTFINNAVYNGTVYKSIARLRLTNPNVYINTVDTDFGVGVIVKTNNIQQLPKFSCNSFIEFSNNKKEILNLISEEQFKYMFSYKINEPLPVVVEEKQPCWLKRIFTKK